MTGLFRWFAAIILLVLSGASTFAQEAPALPFPAEAPLVLHVHGLERTKTRLLKMLAALPPAEAQLVAKTIDDGFQGLFTGRKTSAIPPDGHLFFVVHDFQRFADGSLPIAVLVPVTGYKEFRDSFFTDLERKSLDAGPDRIDFVKLSFIPGEDSMVYVVDLKHYIAITPDKATALEYAGKYTRTEVKQLGAELSTSFLHADISLYVNMIAINQKHRDDIRDYKELIAFSLKQAQMNEMLPAGFDKQQFEQAAEAIEVVFQGIEDCQGLVLAAEFRPAGLNVRLQARFANATPTSKFLQEEKTTPLADLDRLPRGQTSYSATNLSSKSTHLGQTFSSGFQAAPNDVEAAKVLRECETTLASAGPSTELLTSGPGASLAVTTYSDARKAAAAEVKRYITASRIDGITLKEKVQIKADAQQHRGFRFTELQIAMDFEASVKDLPEAERASALALFKRRYREHSTHWIGTDGTIVMHLSATDWPAGRTLIDAYLDNQDGIGTVTGYHTTRKNLPTAATAIWCYETNNFLGLLIDYSREYLKGLPGDFPNLAALKPPTGPPSYIGVALTLKPNTITVDVFIPGEAMNAAVRMFSPLLKPID